MENLANNITLPNWLIYVGVVGGFVVSIIEIIRFVFALFKQPRLEIKLTREVFFRLNNAGESLFANAVLLAKSGIVEVRNISFSLRRTTGSKKVYDIKVLNIGKKINTNEVLAKHYFYTTSPINYVKDKKVTRQLYNSVLFEYSPKIIDKFTEFNKELNDYRNSLLTKVEEIRNNPLGYQQQVLTEINSKVDKYTQETIALVQLEEGKYELVMSVEYSPLHWLSKIIPNKTSNSKITFKVEADFKEGYKDQLKLLLNATANNILFPENQLIQIFPEYQPKDVSEEK